MSYYTRLITFVSGGKLPASDLNAEFDAVKTGIDAIEADVDAAALSVTTAGSNTTSTTSNSIGTGSKTWTVETGKSLVVGMFYRMASTASPTTFAAGTVTAYNSSTGSLTLNVTVTSGSGTITAWTGSLTVAIVGGTMVRRAVTSTDTVIAGDNGGLIDITSGTFTLAYTAAATLGSGFWCVIRNSGTGDVTHDPASSETIDGLTSFVMYPGEARLVQCNGTAFYSIVLSGFNKTFTASGTFTKPPGYQRFAGQLWAGGGGGRKDTNNTAFRHGGGGGACALFDIPASSFGTTETITIGAGGAGQTTTADGGDGGTSSIGSLVNSYGGEGGKTSASSTQGGSAYIANEPVVGSNSYYGGCNQQAATQTVLGGGCCGNSVAGKTVYGGAGGGTISSDDTTLYNPATYSTTVFGGAGGNASVASNGSDGTAPGGGGGATKSGTTSGAGARGELRIWGIV